MHPQLCPADFSTVQAASYKTTHDKTVSTHKLNMGTTGSVAVSPANESATIGRQEAKEAFDLLMNEIQSLRKEVHDLRGREAGAPPAAAVETQEPPTSTSTSVKQTGVTNAESCDVMISLNCKTMLPTAKRMEKFLEGIGIRVWVCVEMVGGTQFRDDIVTAVDTCKVFVPLINEEWCLSKECKFEFNYAFRKNLTSNPEKPVILPICMPGLDWNGHKHVRALLASVNALVYSTEKEEPETLRTLSVSLEHFGVDLHEKKESSGFDDCEEPSLSDESPPRSAAVVDEWEGWYKAVSRTINYCDSNVTLSNTFLVRLAKGGMSSSGLALTAGTLHDNYDGVTCVIAGSYGHSGQFHYQANYSNNTQEQYSGQFVRTESDGAVDVRCYGCSSGYAWFGYGKNSSGEYDLMMHRLDGDDLTAAKEALLQSEGCALENAMAGVGREMDFVNSSFDEDKVRVTETVRARGDFVVSPLAHSRQFVEAPLCVVWNRPEGGGSSDWIGVCEEGSTRLVTEDSWFRAWESRLEHGMVFWKSLTPRRPGRYDLVYFSSDNQEVARHPLEFVSREEMLVGPR